MKEADQNPESPVIRKVKNILYKSGIVSHGSTSSVQMEHLNYDNETKNELEIGVNEYDLP